MLARRRKPQRTGGKPVMSAQTIPVSFVASPSQSNPDSLFETADYAEFKAKIHIRTGIDLNLYKAGQMHRRLMALVERARLTNFRDYYHLLESSPQEYAVFLDRLTINVSELFRNPEKWQELKQTILPALLERRSPLKIWSAGCSYGAEPYSLAILLDQLTPGVRHTIHATDLDRNILAKAREGKFNRADMRSILPDVEERYFMPLPTRHGEYLPDFMPSCAIRPEVREWVTFRAHNLLADTFDTDYDLICCRNVVIYFTDEAKNRLYAQFHHSLTAGGVLFVGGTERIFNARDLGFAASIPFFYHRIK
jgi:chemotaxis protein methyltransferase CheR